MFGRPPPILPNLKSELIAEFDVNLAVSLQVVALVHKDIWFLLKVTYETALPPSPHKFWPGDWVGLCKETSEGDS